MGKRIEVFTSGCPLCRETLETVRAAVCPDCEVIERRCSDDACCDEAKRYGVKAVPTIVVDGEVVLEGRHSLERVKQALAA